MITTRQRLTRYSGSLAVVLGVHGLAILLALNWSKPQPMPIPCLLYTSDAADE